MSIRTSGAFSRLAAAEVPTPLVIPSLISDAFTAVIVEIIILPPTTLRLTNWIIITTVTIWLGLPKTHRNAKALIYEFHSLRNKKGWYLKRHRRMKRTWLLGFDPFY